MSFARPMALVAAVGAAIIAIAGFLAPAAAAAPPAPSAPDKVSVQRLVDEKMRLLPGGRQVGANKIVWDKLGASMEFGAYGPQNCQYEYLCLYGDSDYNDGPDHTPWKLHFWECRVYDLGAWGVRNQASSAVNNQTPGTWAKIDSYRNDRPQDGLQGVWWSPAYNVNPLFPYARNDVADIVQPC